ncbi:TonB-dependent receptor [Sphingomonas colocasiae]|uniref:TonB-dependent receptor n=1 Tax=Sphingomonas colocasiae TaxID=1848973 RepID=A0ABS7PXI7_9SPHN|nr:TonB-dependent receptor [Sphingomonas colocasiae]MBY8826073.1 TonB-dependent receptor [Sphingomonas colocasiae]
MKNMLYVGVAVAALAIPGAAFAQSTGSVDFDDTEIVVTGARADSGVAGVIAPDTSKAKAVLTQDFIARQVPGQTVNDIINQLPGVSFQNNDPFGSAGGKLYIRGFDNSRISQTFDGIPLNDSGNYALYSNQQVDPELIEQVNVNLGTTDVDSPTAAASGSTVNYRTRNPYQDFGAKMAGSVGDYGFFRVFGSVDTGEIGPWGTRAFFAASHAENNNPFNRGGSANRVGKIDKQQYNGRIYQPIGSNGDFVSLSGHYNQNRNNFLGSVALRTDTTGGRVVTNRLPLTKDERFYAIPRCSANTVARPGVADTANSCGSTFDERFNPSNTGNIRGASKFTLADGLVFTLDASFQYTKANGGGTVVGQEGRYDVDRGAGTSLQTGYAANSGSGAPYFGRDLNGDGDILDTVRLLAPSQTITRRFGAIAGLRYDIDDNNTVRVAYSWDRARHRQTGEVGYLDIDGTPFDVFPINDPLADVNGNILQKRDRLSYAILHQIAGEYRGEFLDDRLVVNAGLRVPFMKRELSNYCFTRDASGNVDCFGTNAAAATAYAAANAAIQGPQTRTFKYDKILPNVGFVFDIVDRASIFGNFSMGLQAPRTDSLYNSFFFAPNTPQANPTPETTNNFDLGARYRSSKVQAQVSVWFTQYKNRLAEAYDPDLDRSVFRNLGNVDKYGIDGSISYQPIPEISLYAFGSYMKSKIKDDLVVAELPNGTTVTLPTAGKRESGAPVFTLGGRAQASLGPLDLGAQIKRTGKRFVNDSNLPVYVGAAQTIVYPAAAPAYTLVDLDARLSLEFLGLNDKTYFQLNVTNLFDKMYVGGFDGGNQTPTYSGNTLTGYTSPIFVQMGPPRTVMGSLVVAF